MRVAIRILIPLILLWQANTALAQLPSFEQVKAAYRASDATLLDLHGVPLADIRFDHRVRRFDWVPLERFSPALRDALILSEDHRFFEHDGVDLRAVAGAMWHNLWHSNHRGASTLTMQLAGLLDPAISMPNEPGGRRSFSQKWDQSLAAKELEQRWSKPQILEAYLNLAPFRGDLQGVHAASAVLFGKSPDALDRTEALLITAILPSPNAHAKRIGQRACARARVMNASELCPTIDQRSAQLDTPRNRPLYALAPHLAKALLHQGGERVSTTLDAALQKSTLEGLLAVATRNNTPARTMAALVVDNSDASIRAWVGGLDASTEDLLAQHNTWPNSAALFSVGNALEKRLLTGATLVVCSTEKGQSWHSARTMVQQSETYLGSLLLEPGNEALVERLRLAGFDTPRESLPALNASPAQWAQALRPLVTSGQFLPLHWQIDANTAPHRLWRNDAAFITADFLADASGPRAGLFAEAIPPQAGWTALWRGMNAENNTAMLIALGERYTVASVVQSTRPHRETNMKLAAQAMREILQRIGSAAPSRAPKLPGGLINTLVNFDPPVEPPRKEWFVRGTEMAVSRFGEPPPNEAAPAILVPRTSDHPILLAEDESVVLEATPAAREAQWWVDGVILGQGLQLSWSPAAGHHHVELRSPDGKVWDQREFDTELTNAPSAGQSAPPAAAPAAGASPP